MGVGHGEGLVMELISRKTRPMQLGLEFLQHLIGIGAEPVVAKNHSSLRGQVRGCLVARFPNDGCSGCSRIHPAGIFRARYQTNHAQPQQALNDARVMTERQYEESSGKRSFQLRDDEQIPWSRVAEG
jgi:hypothetical protein